MQNSEAIFHSDPTERWWGVHRTEGWVLFPRDWVANQLAFPLPVPVVFIRCSNWEVFADTYENWRPPSSTYTYAHLHLEALEPRARDLERQKWSTLLGDYGDRQMNLARCGLRLRSKLAAAAFFERTKRTAEQVKWTRTRRNSDPCWQCTDRFNGNLHIACIKCGWLVCWNCGGCGCGWKRRWR